jgi:hypothetical protein
MVQEIVDCVQTEAGQLRRAYRADAFYELRRYLEG